MPRLPHGVPGPLEALVERPNDEDGREQKHKVGPGTPVERREADRREVVTQGIAPFALHRTVGTDLGVEPSHPAAGKRPELRMA